jgi:hypothetical protein
MELFKIPAKSMYMYLYFVINIKICPSFELVGLYLGPTQHKIKIIQIINGCMSPKSPNYLKRVG